MAKFPLNIMRVFTVFMVRLHHPRGFSFRCCFIEYAVLLSLWFCVCKSEKVWLRAWYTGSLQRQMQHLLYTGPHDSKRRENHARRTFGRIKSRPIMRDRIENLCLEACFLLQLLAVLALLASQGIHSPHFHIQIRFLGISNSFAGLLYVRFWAS